jgi:hypothetical protein
MKRRPRVHFSAWRLHPKRHGAKRWVKDVASGGVGMRRAGYWQHEYNGTGSKVNDIFVVHSVSDDNGCLEEEVRSATK